jgi:uncharacterized protein YdcH (DUF465 family)
MQCAKPRGRLRDEGGWCALGPDLQAPGKLDMDRPSAMHGCDRASVSRLTNAQGGLEMFENQNPDDVQAMIERNDEFKRLYHRHKDLDQQVNEAELGVRPMDDMTLHSLKKEKLKAKDRLFFLWEHRT